MDNPDTNPEGYESTSLIPKADKLTGRVLICQGVEALMTRSRDLIIVTNEVGADGVTYTPEVMEYIRLLSRLNRRMAGWADRVVELVCGLPIVWKG